MNDAWKKAAENALGKTIVSLYPLGGGDFAQAFKAVLSDRQVVFVKTHHNPPPDFFSTEAAGLNWLRDSGQVNVPQVYAVSDKPPFLVLQWVEIGQGDAQTEMQFGRQLARLHSEKFSCFGRPDIRATGSQALPNHPCKSWTEFYANKRLLPLAKLAQDKQALDSHCIAKLEKVCSKLDEFGAADEPPSLLHGDLWAGNRVVDNTGQSWLIDPAAHGGHREFDLAMMQLFGGYGKACFTAYHEVYPLQSGWKDRVALHQLAPLVVHAIKFGASYRSATLNALAAYV